MPGKTEAYLSEVCEHIKSKTVHEAIKSELKCHIEELIEGYRDSGYSPSAAEDKALAAMGSAEEIGQRLGRQHRPKMEWSLIVLTAALAILGLIINRSMLPMPRIIMVAGFGTLAMIGTAFFDYMKLKKWSLPLFAALFVCLLVLTVLAPRMHGSHSFIRVPTIGSIMALLFTQLFFPLFAGASQRLRTNGGVKDALKVTGLTAAVMAVSMLLGRMNYYLVYMITFAIILASMTMEGYFAKKRLVLIPTGGLMLISALSFFSNSYYYSERFRAFISAGSNDPLGSGWLVSHLVNTLKTTPLLGSSGSDSLYALSAIDEYAFARLVGKYGWLAGIAIIIVVAALLVRLFLTSAKIKGDFGRQLSLCCCALLLGKFAVNILMNFNLLPVMGVTLPLLGHGGTDYVMTMLLIGLVLSVYRRNDLFAESKINLENN
ncbi:MAG: FtsW/RodA/SpoVE family cell cycle protein [Oscillospiraceae bacterium]|nr:FtsW/RodA/SpoVE family cell cycle protein [Oscillospiraceae bacterium]